MPTVNNWLTVLTLNPENVMKARLPYHAGVIEHRAAYFERQRLRIRRAFAGVATSRDAAQCRLFAQAALRCPSQARRAPYKDYPKPTRPYPPSVSANARIDHCLPAEGRCTARWRRVLRPRYQSDGRLGAGRLVTRLYALPPQIIERANQSCLQAVACVIERANSHLIRRPGDRRPR
jgi:hypothetical protein